MYKLHTNSHSKVFTILPSILIHFFKPYLCISMVREVTECNLSFPKFGLQLYIINSPPPLPEWGGRGGVWLLRNSLGPVFNLSSFST